MEGELEVNPEIARFIGDLERYANRKFLFGDEIALLLSEAVSSNRREVFEDLVFFAKFLAQSYELMKRIGPGGEGYDKVAAEFRSAMEKSVTLMKTLVKETPEETKQRFTGRFFGLDQESLSSVMSLMKELAWVKNWMVDGRSLPA